MDYLLLLFWGGLGLSLIIGLYTLIYRRKDRFSLLAGVITLKPIFSTAYILGIALLWHKFDVPRVFGYVGYELIVYFLPDFLLGIILVTVFRDVLMISWLAILIYVVDIFRWLGWLIFLANFTDYIGGVELIQISFHGFVAIVILVILFFKSKQFDDAEPELSTN
ncbi:MAG: hypothetical protein J0M11_22290 [Anaerolineae bacterium]|nr:hypothetical protein [Anaerolineae bacterium]